MIRKIFVAGHNGMVGRALVRQLAQVSEAEVLIASRSELDLTNQQSVFAFFDSFRPTEVFLAAAKVGGIVANSTYPADFIYDNLQIQNNVIGASHFFDVQKLLFLGSSCIYPREASNPIHEKLLLTGLLEPTNEAYAIAKIAGIKLCESFNKQYGRDYRCVMPTNLYGPGDNYHPENSHVVPGLIRRFHDAKVNGLKHVEVWGSGNPMREFLFVDDMADGSLFVHGLDKSNFDSFSEGLSHINVGFGSDVSIKELAELIRKIVGFEGELVYDQSKPDGTQRKLIDSTLINRLGWSAKISLEEGLNLSYQDFLTNIS